MQRCEPRTGGSVFPFGNLSVPFPNRQPTEMHVYDHQKTCKECSKQYIVTMEIAEISTKSKMEKYINL